jgi:hypothetical protein
MTFDQFAKEPELIEKIDAYTIFQYDIKDGELILTPSMNGFVSDAVKKGLIKGDDEKVTASTAELAAFLEKNTEKVFRTKDAARFTSL